jgi:hypothetical protein
MARIESPFAPHGDTTMKTLTDLTLELGVSRHALERALARLRIEAAGRAGTTRMFDAKAVAALRVEVARLATRRKGVKA